MANNQALLGIISVKLGIDQIGWIGGIVSSDNSVGLNGGISLGGESNFKLGGLVSRNIGKLNNHLGTGFELLLAYYFVR